MAETPKRENYRGVQCDRCGGSETKHRILGSCRRELPEPDGSPGITIEYLFVQCAGCDEGRMLEFVDYGDGQDTVPTVYPTPARRKPIATRDDYPDEVREAYEDAIRALNHNLPKLCSVGIRMLIESAQKERGASSIDALAEQGVLAKDGAKFLNRLRRSGNKAAHKNQTVTVEILDEALGIVESLLEAIYRLPKVSEDWDAEEAAGDDDGG